MTFIAWRRAALAPLVLISLCGVSPSGAAQAQTGGAPLFERLTPAERQLLLSVAGVSGSDQFQPGRLLADLPFPAPALPGQTVVGSVRQPGGSRVIVRTSLNEAQAQQAAERALRAAGWQDRYPRPGGLVFESARGGAEYVSPLCKPGVPGSLTVFVFGDGAGSVVNYGYSAFPVAEGCPAGQPRADRAEINFYAPYRQAPVYGDPAGPLAQRGLKLPRLPAPAGAEVEGTSTSAGDTEFSAYTSVYGPQSTEALRQHYVAALQAQGWQLVDTRTLAGQSVTRLTFRFGTQEGIGTLSLRARTDLKGTPRPPRHDIQLLLHLP